MTNKSIKSSKECFFFFPFFLSLEQALIWGLVRGIVDVHFRVILLHHVFVSLVSVFSG